MATSPTILNSDFRYIDKKGSLMRSRTELSIAQMLTVLNKEYEYNHKFTLSNGETAFVDFKTDDGLIEIIDSEEDITKYKKFKEL